MEYLEKMEFCTKFLQNYIMRNFCPKTKEDFEILGRAIYECRTAPVICEDGSIYNSAFDIARYNRKMTKGQSAAYSLIERAFSELRETLHAKPVEL